MIRTKTLEQGLDLVTGDSSQVGDVSAVVDGNPSAGIDAMEVDVAGEKDIWSEVGERSSGLLDLNDASIDLNDAALFYDECPTLMGMSCMSSSSSDSPADAAMEVPPLDPDGLGDIDNVIGCLSFVDLVDSAEDVWDPSTVIDFHEPTGSEQPPPPPAAEDSHGLECFIDGNSELAGIFVEWLNNNRGKITTEDMKNIKLRRDTIESAARRLGNNVEGKKHLLRLILEWVERHQLHKKRALNYPNPSPNIVYLASVDGGLTYTTHIPTFIPVTNQVVNGIPYIDPAQSWPVPPQYNQFPYTGNMIPQQFPVVYGNPVPQQQMNEENLERLTRIQTAAAATKEARRNRMARQREMHARLRRSSQNLAEEGEDFGADGQYPATGDQPGSYRLLQQGFHSWKQDHRCLRFLLQKVLKQSDVGTLGRIVLPKKEAERHLPELKSGEGITITMEDIGSSQIWSMRYRFWPNNKSRMYLLENTGDFVRANGLQEGDFIVIYMDTRYGKYMIRGIKVRQPFLIPKTKKPASKKNARKAASKASNKKSIKPAA